ncbi:MAG: hypothetical protein WC359_05235 [Dehalococcoidia bacterium]|jgi:hypothetical protein
MVANKKKYYAGESAKVSGKYNECRLGTGKTGVTANVKKGDTLPPHKIGAHWELSRKSK